MKRLLRIRIFIASIVALLACFLVHLFNWMGINFLEWSKTTLIRVAEWFLNYQWYFLVVPFIGFASGFLFQKIRKRRFVYLVPELLYLCASVWILLCLLVWSLQADSSSSLILDRLGYFRLLHIDGKGTGD